MAIQEQADAALVATTSGGIGYALGAFVISMAWGYIFLRIAGSKNRKPATAVVMRVIAILGAWFLAYAGNLGAGGHWNIGAVAAVIVTIAWAAKQQFFKAAAK